MFEGKRNASRQGSIYLRKDGRWAATITIAHNKRRTFYGKTRQEVHEKLKNALYELPRRTLIGIAHPTVEQFIKYWLANLVETANASTYIRYEQVVRIHIIPELGSLYLEKLTPQHLTTFYNQKIEDGLSASTIPLLHTCLYQTLMQAIQEGYVEHNACEKVALPNRAYDVIHPLSKEQARQFLKAIRGHQFEALFTLALATGMRRGELLALKWQDLDLVAGVLQVCRTFNQKQTQEIIYAEGGSKANSNRRSIIIAPFALDPLKQHRVLQFEAKSQAGDHWHKLDLVFCTSNGESLPRNSAIKSLNRFLQTASLPPIGFRDLRHTTATLLLDQGVHPKVVQELLGHRNIEMTLKLYNYGAPKSQREVINQLNIDLQG